jgi:hypothetical protein
MIPVHHQTKGHGAVSVARVAKMMCVRHENNHLLPGYTSH